jgi:predicted flap endonuclease-1-like 5' DNA nuclease
MKGISKSQKELDELKIDYENARQVRKHAKASLKSEKKAIKAHLKPFKLAYKQAIQVEKDLKDQLKQHGKTEVKALASSQKPEAKSVKKLEPKVVRRPKKAVKAPAKPVKKEDQPVKEVKEVTASAGPDDLTIIKGVGDKVAVMLNKNGIKTYADMAATPIERFRELLRANNMSKFRNPVNWAKNAAALAKAPRPAAKPEEKPKRGPKPGVKRKVGAQTAKKAPAKLEPKPKVEKAAKPAPTEKTPGKRGPKPKVEKAATAAPAVKAKRGPKPKVEKAVAVTTEPVVKKKAGRPGGTTKAPAAPAPKAVKTGGPKKAEAGKPVSGAIGDDFTTIKGIGDKVEIMLKKNGLKTFEDLAATSYDRFKELLRNNNMSKFRDPASWASIAAEKAKSR